MRSPFQMAFADYPDPQSMGNESNNLRASVISVRIKHISMPKSRRCRKQKTAKRIASKRRLSQGYGPRLIVATYFEHFINFAPKPWRYIARNGLRDVCQADSRRLTAHQ